MKIEEVLANLSYGFALRLSDPESERGVWVVLVVLAIVGILIALAVLWSGKSLKQFEVDDLYGLLD